MSKLNRMILALALILALATGASTALSEASAELVLPASLKTIGEEAFLNSTSVGKVVLPEGITEIGKRAFAGSTVTEIHLPSTLISIADDAFDGSSLTTVTAVPDTYGYDWAVAHHYIDIDQLYVGVTCSVSEAVPGDTVTWTAAAQNGVTPYKYRFQLYRDGKLEAARAYNTSPEYTVTLGNVGSYHVVVTVKDDNNDTASAQSAEITSSLEELRVTDVTPNLSVIQTGDTVQWTAEVSGGIQPYEYRFTLTGSMGETQQDYSKLSDFSYTFENEGSYQLSVTVRDGQGTESAPFELPVNVALRPVEIVTLAPSATDPQTDDEIIWTVEAAAGKAPYTYSFTAAMDGVTVASATGLSENTFAFTPDTTGTLTVTATVTDAAGGVATSDASVPVTLKPLAALSVTAEETWVKLGDEIKWTVEAIGGVKPLRVAFDIYVNGEEWDGSSFNTSNTFSYAPEMPGLYTVTARVRDAAGTTVTVTGGEAHAYAQVAVVSVTADQNTANTGSVVTWSAQVEGGAEPLSYCFDLYKDDAPFYKTVKDSPVFPYSIMTAGTYRVHLTVTDAKGETAEADSEQTVVTPSDYVTPEECFTYTSTDALHATITGYTGTEPYVRIPDTIGGYTVNHITGNLFQNSTVLETLVLPDGCESISDSLCQNCTSLRGVKLGANLKSIGSDAFSGCTSLESINWNGKLESIGDFAFAGCTELLEANLPDSVTNIGVYAFSNCAKLCAFHFPLNWAKVGDGYTNYGRLFVGCKQLKHIDVPEGVTSIPRMAFDGCDLIESVSLPSTLKTIGGSAFAVCVRIAEFNLPDSVTQIDDSAFAGCTGITQIALPANLHTLGGHAFGNCTSLVNVDFNDKLESIGDFAFAGCTELLEADLPDSVTSIDVYAFSNCAKLNAFHYPLNWAKVGDGYTNYGRLFVDCKQLKHIDVPEGVTSIPRKAFDGCGYIESVSLPSTLKTIGEAAFAVCVRIAEFNLPDSVTQIDDSAFAGCTGITQIALPAKLHTLGGHAFADCTSLVNVDFNDKLESIGDFAFAGCTELLEADLPDSVTSIDVYAFSNCAKLNAFHYPLNWAKVGDGYTNYGRIFVDCKQLKHIDVPEGLTSIPRKAFDGCGYIESVSLPSTLKAIGEAAFAVCVRIAEFNLPDSVTQIDDSAFAGCTGITQIALPANLQTLGNDAFADCTSLVNVDFNDKLEFIGDFAFARCTELLEADLPDSVTNIGVYAFSNCTKLNAFHYPLNWAKVRDGYTNYGRLFVECKQLKHIDVPEGVTSIPRMAFDGSGYIESISLPRTLKTIGDSAFAACSSLGWTYVYPSVTSIGNNAFAYFGENLTIESEYGSCAIDYAIQNGIPYYYLSLTGHQKPAGTLYLGYPFNLYGYVRGSVAVTSVTASLYDENGAVLQTVTANPGETDYSLAGKINRAFDFASLALGQYKFSLEASTGVTSERFYMCDFKIVKEPLSVKTEGFDGPDTYMVLNESRQVTGVLQANYPITAVELVFTYDAVNDEGEVTSSDTLTYSDSSTGNQKSYDLSKLNASYYAAQNAEVHMKITIVADGQTYVAYEADYIVTDNVSPSGMILDMEKLQTFMSDKDNKYFFDFYGDYASRVVDKYASSDKDKAILNMYLYQQDGYKEGEIGAMLEEMFTGASVGKNEYYVNQYKDEITSFINSVGAEWIDSVGYDETLAYDVQRTIAAYPTLKGDIVDELSNIGVSKENQELMSVLIKNIEPLEPLMDCVESVNDLEDFGEVLFRVTRDYTCGQNVLNYLENSYKGTDDQQVYYQMAIDELRELYIGDYCARIDKVFDYLQKEAISTAIKLGEETLEKAFNAGAEQIIGITFGGEVKLILGISKILFKTYTDKTGFYQGAKEYTQFMTIYMTYINAFYSYQEHFGKVNDGSYTDEEVQELMTSFNVTRLAGIRVMRYLLKIPHIEGNDDYAIKQESRKLMSYKNYFYVVE